MEPGVYRVINHSTGERFENIKIVQDNGGAFQLRSSLDVLRDSPSTTERLGGNNDTNNSPAQQPQANERVVNEQQNKEPEKSNPYFTTVFIETVVGSSVVVTTEQVVDPTLDAIKPDQELAGVPKPIKYPLQVLDFLLERIPVDRPPLQPEYPTTTLTYPPSSPASSGRTEVHNNATGVITSHEVFNQNTPEETHVVVTRTPDTGAVNGPVTVHTQVTNTSGVILDDTTSASPTGGNYSTSALPNTSLETENTNSRSSGAVSAETAGFGTDPEGEYGGSPTQPVAETVSPVSNTNNNSQQSQHSDNDSNSHGGGSMSSSESAESAGFGSSEGGEFG